MMDNNITSMIGQKIQEWTQVAPKYPNPRGPVILAKPEYFDQIISNPNINFVVVKALYGYGKTYGFGYGIHHEARKSEKFDAVYINAREVRSKLELGEPYVLKTDPLDIIRMICGGLQRGIVNSNDINYLGIYLATNVNTLSNVCSKFKSYLELGAKNPVEALRQFYLDIASTNKRRIVIVIDEFERLTGKGREMLPDPQTLYGWIEITLDALRPGVIDVLPGQFTLIFLVQEIYYPSDLMKALIERGAYPALGRMLIVNRDGTIPVKYSESSLIDYIRNIVTTLVTNKLVPLSDPNRAISIFTSSQVRKLIREYLTNMPAFVAFSILNEIIEQAVSSDNITTDYIINNFKQKLDQYPIFEIYAGKRTVAKGDYLANVAAGLLSDYYSGRSIRVIPTERVSRVGFEGAYVAVDNEFKVVIFRLSDVGDAQKYINEFVRLYGDALKKYCAQQQSRRQTQTNCELRFLFTRDVNIGSAYNALARLNIVDGIRVAFNVKPIEITHDDLFVLLASYNSDIGIPAGYFAYVNQRRIEVIRKVFS
jgi:hypothetical protein